MKLTPIRRGDSIPMAVVETDGNRGGFVHRLAPCDGFAFEAGDTCGFLPQSEVEARLCDLKLMQQRFKPARRGKR